MKFLSNYWKTYELELTKSNYTNNNRTYLWLLNKKTWEPFCDLSENHAEISDNEIYDTLPWHEAIIINHDFISMFDSERAAKIRIRENIKDCVITWDLSWLGCIYVATCNSISQ